ncbi:MAG: hypothetical protein LBE28_11170 [Providencia alcalifaciens]|jgi:hypothetical protein|nr:hypothetical protein [Providencia alcalifaciens]
MKFKTFSCKKKKKLFLLDENSLQSQPLFWTVIALPLAIGVMLWAAIAYDYDLELTSDAYSRLMKNAQFPFVILALSPILGAFVMYGHRSLQTFTQINATNKQIDTASKQLKTASEQLATAKNQFEEVKNKNRIDMYFSKRKYLYEQIQTVKTERNEKINNPVLLCFHALETNDFNDSKNNDFIKDIDSEINRLTFELGQCSEFFSEDIQNNPSKDYVLKIGTIDIKMIHPLAKVNNHILKMKEKFYVELDLDEKKNIYHRYCEFVDCIDKLNKHEIGCEGEEAAQRAQINYETQKYLLNITDSLINFLDFIQIVFTNLYMNDQIDSLIPALIECKQKCLGWKSNAQLIMEF